MAGISTKNIGEAASPKSNETAQMLANESFVSFESSNLPLSRDPLVVVLTVLVHRERKKLEIRKFTIPELVKRARSLKL